MLPSTRPNNATTTYSRLIFAILVAALLVVGGLLSALGDTAAVANNAVPARSSVESPPYASPTITVTIPHTIPGKIAFRGDYGSGPYHLFTINPDGTGLFTVTTSLASSPAWSFDGKRLAFAKLQPNLKQLISTINADGSNEVTFPSDDDRQDPTWSPDGSKIAFYRFIFSLTEPTISKMDDDGSNVQTLTEAGPNVGIMNPDWSPDGSTIAYVRQEPGGTNHIILMNPDGSNPRDIMAGQNANALGPDWSPDGTKFAYHNRDSGVGTIRIMNADGSNSHAIPNLPPGSEYPSWSPDGNWIAFSAPGSQGDYDLYVARVDGSMVFSITNDPINIRGFLPDWGLPRSIVQVRGEDGLPVVGAQVFHNCDLVGTTGVTGTLLLTSTVNVDDELIARAAVFTGTTQKPDHDGWAYQVWLTNILQNNDGTESPYVITNTNQVTHTLVLSSTNAQIGFNLVASVEYNTTPEHLGQIEAGFKAASEYLMDVTDGQMFFEKVKLYEEGQHFNDADFKFHSWNPRANADIEPDGISALTSANQHIHMSGPDTFGVPYNQVDAYATLIHEFGHYAIGAWDEYYKWNSDDYPASCTLNRDDVEYNIRASIMENQRNSSEFCATLSPIVHNDDTAQGYIQGESVWETLVDNWSSEDELWELRSPITRGEVNKGPIFISCPITLGTNVEIVNVPGGACAPFGITADLSNGEPAVGADITVKHGSTYYYLGNIDAAGIGTVVGASVGDTVFVGMLVGGVGYNAQAVINDCHAISLVLTSGVAPQAVDKSTPGGEAWPAYWLTVVPDWSLNRVDITLHLTADPPATPTLYAVQSGNNRQAVALTYNASQHEYTGTYTFSPLISPDFQFELELPVAGGVTTSVYQFLGGQFHSTGPEGYENMKNLGAAHGNNPAVAPIAWGLLRPESMADIVVKPSSLPDGTGVMVGKSGMPIDSPNSLIPVGGPYSIQGQNPISGEVGLTLSYQSEYFCGLVPGSASIYRYTGSGWQAIPTSLIDEWHQAGGTISEWGIYGVFAQPNAQTTFSDVPVGSTFYDYIKWMTCHGIASGYADNTFRPNNNATRGQISKMISLAYQWYLEPRGGGLQEIAQDQGGILWRGKADGAQAYTFTDVPPGSTFYLYVEAAYREGVVNGYPCGGAGEPCDTENRPYFRPSNNVTRGQIAKIISNGSKFSDPVTGQTFEDVAPGSTFHEFVERMASRAIINGYQCGGPGEPCGPGNRPYFRPQANATRGQLSKMIYLAAAPR